MKRRTAAGCVLLVGLAAEGRLLASAVQTVGSKGYDGFAIAVVRVAADAEPGAAQTPRHGLFPTLDSPWRGC